MTEKEALQLAIDRVGKNILAKKIGCSVRSLNYMLERGKVSSRYALKISEASDVQLWLLCPEYYPKKLFKAEE